jgi:transcriptional regulator with XRE-family HTH domain
MVAATPLHLATTLDRLERELGLSTAELATVLGLASEILGRWRTGETIPTGQELQRLDALLALDTHLHETISSDAIPRWLRRRNHYLGGLTPVEVMITGRLDRVDNALGIIDHGIFT